MSTASRSIIINFRGSIGGLIGSTRTAVGEIGKVGQAGIHLGRDLSQALLKGNVKPIISDVVGGLASMAKVVLLLPGFLLALVNPMNVVSMATLNFSNAISASSPQEFVAATRNMAPAMKDAVMAVRLLEPEIKNLYGTIEQGFWAGAANDIQQLAQVYFPILGQGLGGIGTLLGNLREDLVQFLLEPQVEQTISQWMTSFVSWGNSMMPIVKELLPDFIQLFSDFASLMTDVVIPIMTTLIGWFTKIMNFITPILTGITSVVGAASGATTSGASSSSTSSSSGSGIGGFLGGLISGVGSFFSSLFGLQHGGPVLAGRTYLVGERGPEMLSMGSSSGRVSPVGGGHTYVHVQIGEKDIHDMIDTRIEHFTAGAAMTARMGRGLYQ